MNGKKPNLVVLCDYGLDDAVATANIFNHRDEFGKIDIIAVGGNFSAETSFNNALKLISTLAPYDDRVQIISTVNLLQNSKALYFVHGNDGMGDVIAPCETKAQWIYFEDYNPQLTADDIILSLGPATVAKQLVERYPDCRFIMMGGCVDGYPNFDGDEFNHGMDKESFAFCCHRPHACVMLDSMCEALNIENAHIPTDNLYHTLMNNYRQRCVQNGEKGCYVWDDIAVWYVLRPQLFEIEQKTDKYGNLINCLKYVGGNYLQMT